MRRITMEARCLLGKMSGSEQVCLVSVIVPSYKMGLYIGEALASVGAQIYPHWEIIVVDDAGPEDGTQGAVVAFAQQFPKHRIEFLRHQVNSGVSAARNTAIRNARGEVFAFLDPDDVWLPEKLLKQVQILEANENVAMVYSQSSIKRSGAGHTYAPGLEIFGTAPEEEKFSAVFAVASGKVMFAFSSLVLRRDVFEAVGGFQERLPFQNEDRLLIGSSALFGAMEWVPVPLCEYRIHDGSATTAVIRKRTAYLVEFDLIARLALWLRKQPSGREIGAKIVRIVLLDRLRRSLSVSSWLRSYAVVLNLCVRLLLGYPSLSLFLIYHFVRYCPVGILRRRMVRL